MSGAGALELPRVLRFPEPISTRFGLYGVGSQTYTTGSHKSKAGEEREEARSEQRQAEEERAR